MRVHKVASLSLVLAALFGAAASPAGAAVTTVYKCFDRNMAVVYTDQPCRGEQLDIDAGRADPAALAELQREREALSRAMAQRMADARRAPIDNTPSYFIPPPPVADVDYSGGWGYGGGYSPYGDGRVRDRDRDRGNHGGNRDRDRTRVARTVPAPPPNGITNRTFR